MPINFRTIDGDTQLAFDIMDVQDILVEGGIEHPHIGAIQEMLASRGIKTTITEGVDGVPIIRKEIS